MGKCLLKKVAYGLTGGLLFTLGGLGPAVAADAEFGGITVDVFYDSPFPGAPLYLRIDSTIGCLDVLTNRILIDDVERTIDVSLEISPANFTGCPHRLPLVVPVGFPAEDGSYLVRLYEEYGAPFLDPGNQQGSVTIEIDEAPSADHRDFNAETPAEGSVQSGIGIVRGWACDAQLIEVQFDEQEPVSVAYGTPRTDTLEICGDTNNGYGIVVPWGALTPGGHIMRTFIDGDEVAEVQFTVVGLGEEFATGLSGTYELKDFPAPGRTATVQWIEAEQKFFVVGEQ